MMADVAGLMPVEPCQPRPVERDQKPEGDFQMESGVEGETPENITHYLQGVSFPAQKADLVEFAESHDVDERVLGELRRLPEREYADMEDVASESGPMA